jgi:hypothetical protein
MPEFMIVVVAAILWLAVSVLVGVIAAAAIKCASK